MKATEGKLRQRLAPPEGRSSRPRASGTALDAAAGELAAAARERRIEAICASYLAARRAAAGRSAREIVDRADRAAGEPTWPVIVSAFARRRCYMCGDGTIPCESCRGRGTLNGSPCPQCDGLGREPCEFCGGAGWSDPDDTPPEVRPFAARCRLARLEKELAWLDALPDASRVRGRRLDARRRVELAGRLLRLLGRLRAPPRVETGNGRRQAERFAAAAQRAEGLLDALGTAPPTAGPAAGEGDSAGE